jgi:hypothetical protein
MQHAGIRIAHSIGSLEMRDCSPPVNGRHVPREASLDVGGDPRLAAHPFYTRLNQTLDQHDFDAYVEVHRNADWRGRAAPLAPETPHAGDGFPRCEA